jgi:ArsR family transcriptional regulator, arsenate/arsenite/antimonite-responsive transcriptional repressor
VLEGSAGIAGQLLIAPVDVDPGTERLGPKSVDVTREECYAPGTLVSTDGVMTSTLETRPAGPAGPAGPTADACCAPAVGLAAALDAESIAAVAKALAEPLRVQILDVLRRNDRSVCQCELIALFEIGQSLLSHHMKKLLDAGLVEVERRHKWAYYSVPTDAFEELTAWLT